MKKFIFFLAALLCVTQLWGSNCLMAHRTTSPAISLASPQHYFVPKPPPAQPRTAKQLYTRAWLYIGIAFIAFYATLFVMDLIGIPIITLLIAAIFFYALIASFINGMKCIRTSKKVDKKNKGWIPTLISGGTLLGIVIATLVTIFFFFYVTVSFGG